MQATETSPVMETADEESPVPAAKDQEETRVARSKEESVSAQLVPLWGKIVLGIFLFLVGSLLVYALFALWPAVSEATAPDSNGGGVPAEPATISFFGLSYSPEPDVALLLLVAVVSALGSYIHAAQSFVDFAGNRRLVVSWIWWYPFRILVGVALAEIFYFAIRAGFFGTNTPTRYINAYGIAAVAGLVGLFSKQATDKLRELFETLFRTSPGYGDETREDSLTNPVPVVATVDPATLDVNSTSLEITLRGEGFVRESVVRVSRPSLLAAPAPRETTFVSSGELKVSLEPTDVAEEGSLTLTVFNPGPGGGSSDPIPLEVVQPS